MSFKIRSINELLRSSGNRNLGTEEKKQSVVLEKKNILKKQAELNELRQTVLLKYYFRYLLFFSSNFYIFYYLFIL